MRSVASRDTYRTLRRWGRRDLRKRTVSLKDAAVRQCVRRVRDGCPALSASVVNSPPSRRRRTAAHCRVPSCVSRQAGHSASLPGGMLDLPRRQPSSSTTAAKRANASSPPVASISQSASPLPSHFAGAGGVSDRLEAARVRDGCYRRGHLSSWVVAARCVLRRVERPRGFLGLAASLGPTHGPPRRHAVSRQAHPKVEGSMEGVKYQVLVISNSAGNIASIPDLGCQAAGLSTEAAIANVRRKALQIIQKLEGTASGPPLPSRLELASVELPSSLTLSELATLSTGRESHGALYIMIVQQWVNTLTDPYDRARWPLASYIFSETFLRNLDRQTDLGDIAWICAMVASGLASEFPKLTQRARSSGPRAQLTRADGAKGWRCTLSSESGANGQLDFWTTLSGIIEFDVFTKLRLVRPNIGKDAG
jgi:hypothetical protein